MPTYLQHPNLYPYMTRVEADLWDQLPADLSALLALLPQADLYLQDEIQVAFHPTLTRIWSRDRSTRATNAARHRAITARSMALGWWIGAMAGSMAEWHLDGQLRWDVEQVRAAGARSRRRGRIALVITDNLKTHTSAGSLLVREPGSPS